MIYWETNNINTHPFTRPAVPITDGLRQQSLEHGIRARESSHRNGLRFRIYGQPATKTPRRRIQFIRRLLPEREHLHSASTAGPQPEHSTPVSLHLSGDLLVHDERPLEPQHDAEQQSLSVQFYESHRAPSLECAPRGSLATVRAGRVDTRGAASSKKGHH